MFLEKEYTSLEASDTTLFLQDVGM